MQSNPGPPPLLSEDQSRTRMARRLIIAATLIGLAVGGLAAVDRLREPAQPLAPPHEPAQALITTPAAPTQEPVALSAPRIDAAPSPQGANDEVREPTLLAPGPAPSQSSARTARKTPSQGNYMVQAGTFRSTANARALQRQLQRAGVVAHLETRVQLGPFKNKSDADRALARAKKLGIAAVLVGPY